MRVLGRDPEATVVVLPSDHVVADEETLISAIKAATDHVHEDSNRLVLLGFEPDSPDTGLGWIAPSTSSIRPISGVTRFIEKPSQERAEELLREGALWNSFIFAMRASALFSLFQWSLPWMTRMFSYAFVDRNSGRPWERVSRLYDRLPSVDFSRAVLQEVGKDMRVVAVPPCGWNDVGTPEGVARCTRRCSRHRVAENAPAQTATPALDLAEALREFEEREKGASHAFPL
jgi:mannose-1-phosphate guanylyltransferase